MDKLSLYVAALKTTFLLELKPFNNDTVLIYNQLISTFTASNKQINIEQRMTETLRTGIHTFCEKYRKRLPRLNQFEKIFTKIENGEIFCIFPEQPLSTKDIVSIYTYLTASNQAESSDEVEKIFHDIDQQTEEICGWILANYEIEFIIPIETKRFYVGEPQKSKRVCRFCNRSKKDGVTFQSTAHAIPEALGNKYIILYDECDTCNKKFADTIEQEFIHYLEVFRVFWGIKGKEGLPQIQYENASLKHTDKGTLIHLSEPGNEPHKLPCQIQLISTYEVATVNIYKTLCRMALSVISSKHLKYFQNTINWLNDSEKPSSCNFPKVAMRVEHSMNVEHPGFCLYIRNNENKNIPHVIAEFRFKTLVYIFIIPYSELDDKMFSDDEQFKQFWKTFKPGYLSQGWLFESFSSYERKRYVFTLNLIEGEKPQV